MEASRFNNSCLERLKFYDTNSFEEKSVINENKEQNVIYNSKRNKNFSSINRTQQQQPSLLCLISNPTKRKTSTIASPLLKILSLIILYSFLNYDLNNILSKINRNHLSANGRVSESLSTIYKSNLPTIILAGAIECQLDGDCVRDKVCHENKCICARTRPIELDQDRCLPLALINEQCTIYEQCLGNSQCVDGICSCGSDAISLFNPSTGIYYCHPKRGLNEQCNHDSQCPSNSYCSTKKSGCLCLNGYAEAIVNNGGKESRECLPKFCTTTLTCESEYHECDDGKCKCLPSHFDPTTAKCYKFGSTGGENLNEGLNSTSSDGNRENVISKNNDNNNSIYTILRDLTENGDKMWLVLIILISLSIIIFVLIFLLLRKHYLGYCWTANKKEYEPNNKNPPRNGYFNKNSINNKSFRQKSSGEVDDENDNDQVNGVAAASTIGSDDLATEDRSSLFISSNKRKKNDDNYIKVNVNDDTRNHYVGQPLLTSTSTPV